MSKLLSKQIVTAQRKLLTQAKQIKARAAILRRPEVKSTWQMFPLSLRKNVDVRASDWTDSVYLSVMLTGLDSLKDDRRLLSVLEPFAGDNAWQASTSDYAGGEVPNRDFTFHKLFGTADTLRFSIYVTVCAYVKTDSPSCRIETRVREETVRKEERVLVCA